MLPAVLDRASYLFITCRCGKRSSFRLLRPRRTSRQRWKRCTKQSFDLCMLYDDPFESYSEKRTLSLKVFDIRLQLYQWQWNIVDNFGWCEKKSLNVEKILTLSKKIFSISGFKVWSFCFFLFFFFFEDDFTSRVTIHFSRKILLTTVFVSTS